MAVRPCSRRRPTRASAPACAHVEKRPVSRAPAEIVGFTTTSPSRSGIGSPGPTNSVDTTASPASERSAM
jgi:hypothetical protein